ncbi:hypothetical protein QTG54_016705 [Skeletonema marinoi]|uniref:Uncharacterized protein n=1 Tax=Skeletonema marinoi TaxID=267567 RepID=A0AAD9D4F9_9STRA|nr:hypothetical protein QTG54_016705 [Skeletonema marinoi]
MDGVCATPFGTLQTRASSIIERGCALLELALWKANLDEDDPLELEANVSNLSLDNRSRSANARKQRRVTSGAGVVIKGVLPFLRFAKDSA